MSKTSAISDNAQTLKRVNFYNKNKNVLYKVKTKSFLEFLQISAPDLYTGHLRMLPKCRFLLNPFVPLEFCSVCG